MSDTVYSNSRINTFITCPYGFNRRYNLGEVGENNWFAELGSLVHSLSEDFYAKGGVKLGLSLEEIRNTLLSKFERGLVSIKSPLPMIMNKKSAQVRIDNIRHYLRTFVPIPNMAAVEKHITWELSSGHLFQGYIDELVREEENFKVGDIKAKYETKYDQQLNTYCLGIKAKTGKYPSAVYVRGYVTAQTAEFVVDEARVSIILETQEDLISTIGRIEKEKKWKALGSYFYCNNLCNFRNDCKFKINR